MGIGRYNTHQTEHLLLYYCREVGLFFKKKQHILQDQQSFLMFTGGGSILLEQSLSQLVTTKRSPYSFLFVPADIASTLNAIGGYVLAQALAQRKLERLTTTDRSVKGTR